MSYEQPEKRIYGPLDPPEKHKNRYAPLWLAICLAVLCICLSVVCVISSMKVRELTENQESMVRQTAYDLLKRNYDELHDRYAELEEKYFATEEGSQSVEARLHNAREEAKNNSNSPTPVSVQNGEILLYPLDDQLAPLSVETTGSENYYIYLDDVSVESPNDMAFYVTGGSSAEIDVPLGEYEIYYAVGSTWCGREHLFGSETTRYKCEGTFSFYIDDGYYRGWTLELYLQTNGNMDTEEVSAAEFPG